MPNASAPVITVTVKVDPGFLGSSIANEASALAVVDPISEADPQGNVVTAKDGETTAVARSADLSIDKSVSATSAAAGDTFNWVLDVVNHGPDTATNVAVSDTVPAAFQIVTVTPTGGLACTNTTSKVDCSAATMTNGATAKVTIQVRVVATAAAGAVTNTATVSSDTPDPTAPNNSDTASVTVTQAASGAPVPGTTGSGVGLPRTGNGPLGGPLTLAGLLIGGGLLSLVVSRRRRAARAA
jgi:uncharacterized repeat protein (TIGR01451 family)